LTTLATVVVFEL